jgi:hypothetical protein
MCLVDANGVHENEGVSELRNREKNSTASRIRVSFRDAAYARKTSSRSPLVLPPVFLYYLLILPHYTDGGHSSAELLVRLWVKPVTLRDLNVSERRNSGPARIPCPRNL